jgi:hypothetical protein
MPSPLGLRLGPDCDICGAHRGKRICATSIGFLAGKPVEWAVRCGVAHGALAMTTAGDTSMATLAEVERAMKGGSARIAR